MNESIRLTDKDPTGGYPNDAQGAEDGVDEECTEGR